MGNNRKRKNAKGTEKGTKESDGSDMERNSDGTNPEFSIHANGEDLDDLDTKNLTRSPVKKLAKRISEEIQREKSQTTGEDTLNSTNNAQKETIQETLRVKTRSSAKRGDAASTVGISKQTIEPDGNKSPEMEGPPLITESTINNKVVENETEEIQTVTTPIHSSKGKQRTPKIVTPAKSGKRVAIKRLNSIKKGVKRNLCISDDESDIERRRISSSSSETPSSSSESEEERYKYRRSRSKKKKHDRKKRSRRSSDSSESRSRSRSQGRRSKPKKSKKHSGSYRRKSESMKEILKELSALKKQLKEKREGRSQPLVTDKVNEFDNTAGEGNTPTKVKTKSQSDTTLYSPAIAKNITEATNEQGGSPHQNVANRLMGIMTDKSNDDDYILNYIKRIRLAGSEDAGDYRQAVRSEVTVLKPGSSAQNEMEQENHAQAQAREEILEAERYKASLQTQGRCPLINNSQEITGKMGLNPYTFVVSDPDDEFFHIVCHVEKSLRQKIEKGQFVELDKLLKKSKLSRPTRDSLKMEMGAEDGKPYWIPAEDKETRINNVYKWDKAFRVYAAIYSKANSTRCSEIWQYIESIHTAAKTFAWDSVANYDYVFRQLMEEYPTRSWAKTYTQMWNQMLCEPLKQNVNNDGRSWKGSGGTGSSHNNTGNWRDRCCWKFNRNKCKNPACRFDHRCTYCGGFNHSFVNCTKRNGSRKSEDRRKGGSPSK